MLDVLNDARSGEPRRLVVRKLMARERALVYGLPGAREQTSAPDGYVMTFPLEPYRVTDIQARLKDSHIGLTKNAAVWWQRVCERASESTLYKDPSLSSFLGFHDDDVPFRDRLYAYQRVGVRWLRLVERGILGDEMGLGKTVQALAASREARFTLIVTVNLAKRAVWERELKKWLGETPIAVYVADGAKPHRQYVVHQAVSEPHPHTYLIINHEMLQQRFARDYSALYTTDWDVVIVDEAHKFQDHQSSQSKGAQRLRADSLYLLTGTPVWNRAESIFGLLHLLDPHRWSSFWMFVDEYCDIAQTPWAREIVGVKPEKMEQLQALLAPVVLRREAVEVLPDLPDLRIQDITYQLEPDQRKVYRRLKSALRLETPTGELVRVESSTSKAFVDLRRLCNSPVLLGFSTTVSDAKTPMVDWLIDAARDEARKVVVFVWHHDYASFLDVHLTFRGIGHRVLTGLAGGPDREEALNAFATDPETQVLIASIALAGTAIDLTAASVAIFAEGSHVPTHFQQALKRLHRHGQKLDVQIYRLLAEHTVESALWSVVDERADQTNEMLAFREVLRRTLTQEDD